MDDNQFPFRLVTEKQAAELLATPAGTLRYWRIVGKGPQWIRLGGRVKYDVAELEAYVNQSRVGVSVQPAHRLSHGERS